MIELSRRGNIAVLTMAYGKANALDIEFCDGISAQFEKLRDAPERAVVLTLAAIHAQRLVGRRAPAIAAAPVAL